MPKNTTQCPRPGLETGPLDPESSTLTVWPSRFLWNCCITSTCLIFVVCDYLCILDPRDWGSTTDLFSRKRYNFDFARMFNSVLHQLLLFLLSFDWFTGLSVSFVIC